MNEEAKRDAAEAAQLQKLAGRAVVPGTKSAAAAKRTASGNQPVEATTRRTRVQVVVQKKPAKKLIFDDDGNDIIADDDTSDEDLFSKGNVSETAVFSKPSSKLTKNTVAENTEPVPHTKHAHTKSHPQLDELFISDDLSEGPLFTDDEEDGGVSIPPELNSNPAKAGQHSIPAVDGPNERQGHVSLNDKQAPLDATHKQAVANAVPTSCDSGAAESATRAEQPAPKTKEPVRPPPRAGGLGCSLPKPNASSKRKHNELDGSDLEPSPAPKRPQVTNVARGLAVHTDTPLELDADSERVAGLNPHYADLSANFKGLLSSFDQLAVTVQSSIASQRDKAQIHRQNEQAKSEAQKQADHTGLLESIHKVLRVDGFRTPQGKVAFRRYLGENEEMVVPYFMYKDDSLEDREAFVRDWLHLTPTVWEGTYRWGDLFVEDKPRPKMLEKVQRKGS